MNHMLMLILLAVTLAFGQTKWKQDVSWQAPPKAAVRKNPLPNRPEIVGGGEKLFERHCTECHGKDGRGIGKAANLRSFEVQIEPDGTLFWKITNGNLDRGMPDFSGLPEAERWQLVLYLRQLGK